MSTSQPTGSTLNQRARSCESSYAAPVADTVAGVAILAATGLGLAALLLADEPDESSESAEVDWVATPLAYGAVASLGVLGGVFTTSAITGFDNVSACREARTEAAVRGPGWLP